MQATRLVQLIRDEIVAVRADGTVANDRRKNLKVAAHSLAELAKKGEPVASARWPRNATPPFEETRAAFAPSTRTLRSGVTDTTLGLSRAPTGTMRG